MSYRRKGNEGTHKGTFIGCVRNIPETQQPSGGGGDIFGEMGEDVRTFYPVAGGGLPVGIGVFLRRGVPGIRPASRTGEGGPAVVVVVYHLPFIQRQDVLFQLRQEEAAIIGHI